MHDDGLTTFQRNAISAVASITGPEKFNRVAMPNSGEECLTAPLGVDGAVLWIYTNDAGIFGVKPHAWFEEWDYRMPDELLKALVSECIRRTSINSPNRAAAG